MNRPSGRLIPILAAAASVAFVAVLIVLDIRHLRAEGIEIPQARLVVWTIFLASLAGAVAYVLGSMPRRARVQAEALTRRLRENELHLQQVFDVAPVIMYRADSQGILTFVEGAEKMGYAEPPGGWAGRSVFDFGGEDEEWIQAVKKALGGEVVSGVILADGRTWDVQHRPWDVDGQPAGIVGVVTDITGGREAELDAREEQAARNELEQLRRMNEMKTNLLNTAAHELNTPMTPVRLQLHLLKSRSLGDLTDKQERAVAILDRAVDRLSLLVDDILDVARVQSGKMKVELKPVRVSSLLREVVDTFEETAREVGVSLKLQRDDDLWMNADPARITQVLTNLTSNAIKFTPEGGRVEIAAKSDGDGVRVEFKDTGRGLEPAEIERLFQPFSQVHDLNEITARGTGLGLYISRGIIDRHEGDIGVESKGLGKGSTFYFRVPASEPGEGTEVVPEIEAPKPMVVVAPQLEKKDSGLAKRLRELI